MNVRDTIIIRDTERSCSDRSRSFTRERLGL